MKKYSQIAGRSPSSAPTFLLGDGPNRQLYTLVDTYCENPNCHGAEATMELVPERQPARTISFRVHLLEAAFDFPDDVSEEERKMAMDFVEEHVALIARRRQLVRGWGLRQVRRRAGYDPGKVYCFEDFMVRKDSFAIPFWHGGQKWAVIDSYCVNPACSCEDAILQLFKVREGMAASRPKYAVSLDLTTGLVSARGDNPLENEAAALVASFKDALGDWRDELSLRREVLRGVAKRRLRFSHRDPVVHTAEEPEPAVVSQPASGPVFRNDPCPCGSGRKYKNCCGR